MIMKLWGLTVYPSGSYGLAKFVNLTFAFDKHNSGFLHWFHTMPKNKKEKNR